MSFKENKYLIVKGAISPELSSFCYNYFLLKRQAVGYMYTNKIASESPLLGYWRDEQVPGVYSHYADMVMETLLVGLTPKLNQASGFDLVPTYSYARIYQKGSELLRHKDRESCEISATLNLGGDPWPIYIDPTGNDNVVDPKTKQLKENASEGLKIDLAPGDLMLYRGCDIEHWRHKFEGKVCAQVFFHYNDRNGKFGETNLLDGRAVPGLPRID